MKKTLITLAMILMGFTQMFAMSTSKMRNDARFLSDRMAYELDLTPMQYDDCYEINFDFIYAIDRIIDEVVYGYTDAIEEYYRLLDYRNEDLRYVLNARQYARFIALDYFYRPIYSTGRSWAYRIYSVYTNHSHFYFHAPSIFHSYRGGHSHIYYNHNYYNGRHHHDIHRAPAHIHGTPHMHDHGRHDFGSIRHERNEHHLNGSNHRHDYGGGRPQGGNRHEGASSRPQGGNRHEGASSRPQGGNRHEGASSRPQSSSRPQNAGSRREHSGSNGGTRSQGGGGRQNGGNRHEGGSHGGRR